MLEESQKETEWRVKIQRVLLLQESETSVPSPWIKETQFVLSIPLISVWLPSHQRPLPTYAMQLLPKAAFPFVLVFTYYGGFPGGSHSKELACNARDPGLIPGSGRSPEKGMETHFSILALSIPWTEELVRLQSMGSQRLRHDWATNTWLIQVLANLHQQLACWFILCLSIPL